MKRDIDHIDEEPLAVASLGQVHRGQLRSGEEVVIKITKADFEEPFRADVAALRSILRSAIFFYPKLDRVADPVGVLDSVETMTLREMDLRNELRGGQKLESIRATAKKRLPHLKELSLPRSFPEYTDRDILVSSYVKGPTLNDRIAKGLLDYSSLLTLFRIHGFFLFNQGVFHGDLHPGNIILDNANVEEVPRSLAADVLRMLFLIGRGEFRGVAEALGVLSVRLLDKDAFDLFCGEFLDLYEDFEETPSRSVACDL